MDIVRVLRVLEYVGERSEVERTLARSIQGEKITPTLTIRAATIGLYPEVLGTANNEGEPSE